MAITADFDQNGNLISRKELPLQSFAWPGTLPSAVPDQPMTARKSGPIAATLTIRDEQHPSPDEVGETICVDMRILSQSSLPKPIPIDLEIHRPNQSSLVFHDSIQDEPTCGKVMSFIRGALGCFTPEAQGDYTLELRSSGPVSLQAPPLKVSIGRNDLARFFSFDSLAGLKLTLKRVQWEQTCEAPGHCIGTHDYFAEFRKHSAFVTVDIFDREDPRVAQKELPLWAHEWGRTPEAQKDRAGGSCLLKRVGAASREFAWVADKAIVVVETATDASPELGRSALLQLLHRFPSTLPCP